MQIVFAILAFGVLIFVHELGHFLMAKLFSVRVPEFALGLGPRIVGFTRGETTYSLRALPFGGMCAMEGEDGETDENGREIPPSPRSFVAQKPWKRFLILVAGPLMNILFGFLLLFITVLPAAELTTPTIADLPEINRSEAENALHAGDTLLAIDGEAVYLTNDISILLERHGAGDGMHDLTVRREGKRVTLKGVYLPYREYTYNGATYQGYGLILSREKATLGARLAFTGRSGIYYARLVRFGLEELFRGRVTLNSMSGPVGITATMSSVAKTSGIMAFLSLVAFIAINLGIMNLLPIPALDGGRIFFLLIECVIGLFGLRMPRKAEGYVNAVALILLLALSAVVAFNDISRLIAG